MEIYVIMAVFDGWESHYHSLGRLSSMACCFDMGLLISRKAGTIGV